MPVSATTDNEQKIHWPKISMETLENIEVLPGGDKMLNRFELNPTPHHQELLIVLL